MFYQKKSLKELRKMLFISLNPLIANPIKWSDCLSVFDHFVRLAFKGLKSSLGS